MSTEVCVDEAEKQDFDDGFSAVRDDQSPVNWVLVTHPDNNPNRLSLECTGTEGLPDLADRFMDDKAQYALVRMTEEIDMSTTVKFVFIKWRGNNVPLKLKNMMGVIAGSVENYFSPYHCTIDTDTTEELTEEYVMERLQEQSGQRSKVLEATVAKTRPERGFTSGTSTKADSTGATPNQGGHVSKVGKMGTSFAGMSGMAKASGGAKVGEDVTEAVSNVTQDDNSLNWCIAGYGGENPKNSLVLLGSGEGGVDEIVEQFSEEEVTDKIRFGYVRVEDELDGIRTVKFAYVQWVGEGVKPMAKAKVSTQKGMLEGTFKPCHVSIYANIPAEVTSRIINDKVASASGSKSHIRP